MLNTSDFLGRILIVTGVALVILGLITVFVRSLRLGALPGDINLTGRGWHISFPLATSLLISLVLTILLNLILRRR